jgi:hypothetical protein
VNDTTTSSGHCPQWDTFDIDVALEVLDPAFISPAEIAWKEKQVRDRKAGATK